MQSRYTIRNAGQPNNNTPSYTVARIVIRGINYGYFFSMFELGGRSADGSK